MILAVVLSMLSGALCAIQVCKAIQLRWWLDVCAAIGCGLALLEAAHIAGTTAWPLFAWPAGFAAVVVWLRVRAKA